MVGRVARVACPGTISGGPFLISHPTWCRLSRRRDSRRIQVECRRSRIGTQDFCCLGVGSLILFTWLSWVNNLALLRELFAYILQCPPNLGQVSFHLRVVVDAVCRIFCGSQTIILLAHSAVPLVMTFIFDDVARNIDSLDTTRDAQRRFHCFRLLQQY